MNTRTPKMAMFHLMFLLCFFPEKSARADPPKIWIESQRGGFFQNPMTITDGHQVIEWGVFGPDLRPLVNSDPDAVALAEKGYKSARRAKVLYFSTLAFTFVGGFGMIAASAKLAQEGHDGLALAMPILYLGGSFGGLIGSVVEMRKCIHYNFRAINTFNGVYGGRDPSGDRLD